MYSRIFVLSVLVLTACRSTPDDRNSFNNLSSRDAEEIPKAKRRAVSQKKPLSKGYRTVSLYGDKLQISVPDYFTEMSSEMKQLKYPRSNAPQIIYTDERAAVNVALGLTATKITVDDISASQSSFLKLLQPVSLDEITTRIETINGSEFAVFEFMSQGLDTKIYNLMFLTELDGRMLLGSFNCTEALKEKWQLRAREILLSVRKGKL